MNTEQFESHLQFRLEKIREVLEIKAREYRRNDNPLHNFEQGAKITGETSAKVLDGFLLKHIISYRDIISDIESGKLPHKEMILEKFGDIINYFILQEALICELVDGRIKD